MRKNTELFGNFYISCNQDYPPFSENPYIYKLNSLNQIQINTGNRITNIFHVNSENKSEIILERSSTLWFSQDITGAVAVFIAPYLSQSHSVNEKDILIKNYNEPTKITDKEIKKIFKTYLRYCEATMSPSAKRKRLYSFRLWLQLKDIRNRRAIKKFCLKTTFQAMTLCLAFLGILATLIAGSIIKI
ncbi:hypothetical protein [Citrobacter telavivensis]|uniref:hypothetical protein n=1 Tax=Citrobacter telavivensis TaxID=2653932 RepID=UPI00359D95F9